jgi:hypothetical protein
MRFVPLKALGLALSLSNTFTTSAKIDERPSSDSVHRYACTRLNRAFQ